VLLLEHTTALAELARQPFRSAVFLGTGCRFGSARESALKLQEMSAGRVFTFAETFLGLRHGPMASVREDTLVVCFVSSDPLARAYEMDLIRELDRKGLGGPRLLFGENVPSGVVRSGDVVLDLDGLSEIGDDHVAVLDVVAGQLLAFYRSLAEGLDPDQPSTGAISRVVEQFKVYERPVEAAR
jgi:tagatose-6-phosphate ketose/aldose isomerase